MFFKLAVKSLGDRKGAVCLSILVMCVSIVVLLGVGHVRHQAKEGFYNTVSGVDLIVGARTSSVNMLLYTVFPSGTPTNSIRWESYQDLANSEYIEWLIPISLGDSHKGYRVLGTTSAYFEHFSYGQQRRLSFAQGKGFEQMLDVVIGSEIAKSLHYELGDTLVLAHGLGATSFSHHDDQPFVVTGILAPTGTPVDQTLFVHLHAIEWIHKGSAHSREVAGSAHNPSGILGADLLPESLTAMFVGLKSKLQTFHVQRLINNYKAEPLSAVLPGVALSELWQLMAALENALVLISVLVLISACLGVSAMLLSTIRDRHREIQLLRAMGAPPLFLFALIQLEAAVITFVSVVLAVVILMVSLIGLHDYVLAKVGMSLSANIVTPHSMSLIGVLFLLCALVAMIPSLWGYLLARRGAH